MYFLPIYSERQVRWMSQPGSHRRKVTQDFSSISFLRSMPLFFSREEFSRLFPLSTVNSIFCTNDLVALHLLLLLFFVFVFFSEGKSQLTGFEFTTQRVRRLRGYQLSYRGDRYEFRRGIDKMGYTPGISEQNGVDCFSQRGEEPYAA